MQLLFCLGSGSQSNGLLVLPDITVTKMYYPEEDSLQVYLSRVQPCPPTFPHGFYWYGGKQYSPGKIPHWVQSLLEETEDTTPRYNYATVSKPVLTLEFSKLGLSFLKEGGDVTVNNVCEKKTKKLIIAISIML